MARGKHLFPFRTEQLSPSAPMVLGPQGPGRVGRRRSLSEPLRPCQRRPAGAERTPSPVAMADFHALPPDLPAPLDDGAADHLVGAPLPAVALRATSGPDVVLASLPLVVVYVYPRTGAPGVALPDGWDEIPGARGCTVQNCVFRDHARGLSELGAVVHGLSAQPFEEQVAFAERAGMQYPLLN